MQLRDYQQELIHLTRAALSEHRIILLVAPTGAGKTAMSSYILAGVLAKNKRAGFFVHRRQLIKQVSNELNKQNIPHGFIAAGYITSNAPIKIAMQQSASRRAPDQFDLLVVDEAHLNVDTYSEIIKTYPSAKVVLLSATPELLSGSAIPAEIKIETVDTATLIERGHLAPYRYYAPSDLDFSKVHSRGGDYIPEEVGEIAEKSSIIGNAIEHYKKYGNDGLFLNFSYSVAHSKRTAEAFTAAGYPCVHLDSDSTDDERDEAFRKLSSGELRGISNASLFCEGMDYPALEVVIIQKPTKSMMRNRQMLGRVLRTHSGKTHGIILDMVNNYKKLGLPDDKYEWQWRGRNKKSRSTPVPAVSTCKLCFAVFKPHHRECPECGASIQTVEKKLEVRSGELIEIRAEQKKLARIEVGRADSFEGLLKIERERGYKPGWAAIQWRIKQKRKSSKK